MQPQEIAKLSMERLEKHIRTLQNIKEEINETFLRETSLADLKGRIWKANDATNFLEQAWDDTTWEDLPDAETVGYEGKKQEAKDLRDEIRGLLEPRIKELEGVEAKSELAGAKAVQQSTGTQTTSLQAQLNELTEIHEQLKKGNDEITKEYLKENPRTTLEPKLTTIEVLQDSYLRKYHVVDKGQLSVSQSTALQTQRTEVDKWTEAITTALRKQITTLTISEQAGWIRQHGEAREKADKNKKM